MSFVTADCGWLTGDSETTRFKDENGTSRLVSRRISRDDVLLLYVERQAAAVGVLAVRPIRRLCLWVGEGNVQRFHQA